MAKRRADEWRRLVRVWEKSGLSARRFAEREGVAPRTLIWWRWRFRTAGRDGRREQAKMAGSSARAPLREVPEVALVRVVAAEPATAPSGGPDAAVELVFGDVVVRVRRGFDAATLGRVIEVLDGHEGGTC